MEEKAPVTHFLRLLCALPISALWAVAAPAAAEDAAGIGVHVAAHSTSLIPALELAPPALGPTIELELGLPPVPTIDLTAGTEDLWERIRYGFAMPDLDSDLVAKQQAYYLNNPQYLERITERSRRYLHHIVEELEKRGMPTEIALLPMVESAFNPMAYSRARASGLWQFIPSTGRNYRLKQDYWIDQRRDVVASTAAALDYLQTIYQMHGDWHLALASYNWGEGAVARAIDKNLAKGLPTDYSSLSMPAETRNYIPKLQALKNIVAHPERYGISLRAIPNKPYFATVDKRGDMDMALAAKLAEMPLDEFMALNPGYKRPVVTGQAKIVLPADKVETFLANLEEHDKPLINWTSYTLQRGERLEQVAQRYGISEEKLRSVNGLSERSRMNGRTVLVPSGAELGDASTLASAPPPPPEPPVEVSSVKTRTIVVRGKHGKKRYVVVRIKESGKLAKQGGHGKLAKAERGKGGKLAARDKPGKSAKAHLAKAETKHAGGKSGARETLAKASKSGAKLTTKSAPRDSRAHASGKPEAPKKLAAKKKSGTRS